MPDTPSIAPPPSVIARSGVNAWWRALAIALMVALFIGWAASASMVEQLKAQIAHLQAKVSVVAQVQYLSVLLDDKQVPALLVTADVQGSVLHLQRLNEVREGREDSMQLWALEGDKPPRSLGVIASTYKTLQLPTSAAALAGVHGLAISVEDKGGAAEGRGPRRPYLFKGALVKKAL
ncbi:MULTISPECIES: anti-sigma factor domain-containing protein [unclassified Acidovorax]|uniref:anti-sigma factor domain-containing protein n=1 Tax=unclassified Acidovorax TaxID=2684926 RepID=UPI000B40406E|nr:MULTISPECIES: anti-sigma factor [unclassified Acidovorax]